MTEYEYGIDWKKVDRRDDTPHRSGMTLEQAEAFLVNDAHDNFKWSDIFIIIRRKIGLWEDLPAPVTLPRPSLSTWDPKLCGNGGCGSSAGLNGYCGPNGCYNYPG